MKIISSLVLILLLAACAAEGPSAPAITQPVATDAPAAEPGTLTAVGNAPTEVAGTASPVQTAATSMALVVPPKPAASARTVEEFDTTTPAARAAAVKPAVAPTSGDGRLGTTVASLGAAGEPGFWIKTPLVKERTAGRLFYAKSGRNVQVQLIPTGGGSGSGSQVSLAAMRLLDAPLDGLPEIVVYTN